MMNTTVITEFGTTSKRNDLLKIIAMVTMLIDHVGVLLLPQFTVLRVIGRVAFPIFAYQIAVGYDKTSNRMRYFQRIITFGIISQGPYMFLNAAFRPEWLHFNVMLLFGYAIGILWLYDAFIDAKEQKKRLTGSFVGVLLFFFVVLPLGLEAYISGFAFSYGTYGLVMILIFYRLRDYETKMIIAYLMLEIISTYYINVQYLYENSVQWIGTEITYMEAFLNIKDNLKWILRLLSEGYYIQTRSVLGLFAIVFLSRHQYSIRLNKYVAYIFYPAHILMLVVIRIILQ